MDQSEGFIIGPENPFLLFDSFLVDGVDESQRLGKSLCGLGHSIQLTKKINYKSRESDKVKQGLQKVEVRMKKRQSMD